MEGGYSGWFLPLRGVLLGSLTPALWSALRGCIHPCAVFVGAALRGSPPPENPRGEKKGNVGGWGIEKGKKGEAQRRFLRHQCLEIPFGCELGLML